MSELAPSKVIQRLEQRHEQLIEELDSLNERLEQALNSFGKTAAEPLVPSATVRSPEITTAVGRDVPTC